MADIAALVAEMRAVAPGGRVVPDPAALHRLQELTGLLVEADPSAVAEHARFLGVRGRRLPFDRVGDHVREALAGERVLVTGGTGCIGSELLAQLEELGAGPLFSVTRGRRRHRPRPGVTYLNADICDQQALDAAFAQARPTVVFHVAAQRDPGLAERTAVETVLTNAIGTRNVVRSALAAGVRRLSHASTGKAMRYYTKDIYACSKKLGEWVLQAAAPRGLPIGAARFTHVVNNSIVLRNFEQALDGGIVKVHDANIAFYVQSAAESAQLLLLAGLNDHPHLRMLAIRDLDDPVRLLPMALGLIARSGQRPPLWFTGYEAGYESGFQPGLYDPRTAGDLSPLINALEADSVVACADVPEVDQFVLNLPADDEIDTVIDELERVCRSGSPSAVVDNLHRVGRQMTLANYRVADQRLFERMQRMAMRTGAHMPCTESFSREPALSASAGS